jgi:hypothetical protein
MESILQKAYNFDLRAVIILAFLTILDMGLVALVASTSFYDAREIDKMAAYILMPLIGLTYLFSVKLVIIGWVLKVRYGNERKFYLFLTTTVVLATVVLVLTMLDFFNVINYRRALASFGL